MEECPDPTVSKGGLCCNETEVNDDGLCKEECPDHKSDLGGLCCLINSDKSQRWRLDANKLENKEGLWKSDDMWNFRSKDDDSTQDDDFIYIENTSKTKVFRLISDSKVIQEVFEEGIVAEQLWKKGKPDSDGYFTFENSAVPKVITAISESSLEIKGNITLRWILLERSLFVDYLPCFF